MAILVDDLKRYNHGIASPERRRDAYSGEGRWWCHMFSSTNDLAELHHMAALLGLRRSYFQGVNKSRPHYDLTPGKRAQALKLGAIEVNEHGDIIEHPRLL